MKQNDVKDFISRVQETEIEIKVKDGKIKKNFAKGTTGSIAFLFTDIYARLIIGVFSKTSQKDALEAMNKIQENATARVQEFFEKKKKS